MANENFDENNENLITRVVVVSDNGDGTYTGLGEKSSRGSVGFPVFIQDQTSGILDLLMRRVIGTAQLQSATAANDRTIALVSAASVSVGNTIMLNDNLDGSSFYVGVVLSIIGNSVFMDTPINAVFDPANTNVRIKQSNMAVNGSVTPVIFEIKPEPNQVGDMVRFVMTIADNAAMDFETFGGLPRLTNGIVLRINSGDGTYRNIANFKSHNDISRYTYDTSYKVSNGGTVRGFQARGTWGGQHTHGAVIRLDGSRNESLEMVIQDDLTGLVSMDWQIEGSEVQR